MYAAIEGKYSYLLCLTFVNFWHRYDHCFRDSRVELVLLPLAAQFECVGVEPRNEWTGLGNLGTNNWGGIGGRGEQFSRSLLAANLDIYPAERSILISKTTRLIPFSSHFSLSHICRLLYPSPASHVFPLLTSSYLSCCPTWRVLKNIGEETEVENGRAGARGCGTNIRCFISWVRWVLP